MVWEIRRQGKNRYKSLTKSQCEAIETDHQRYEHERAIGKRTQARRHIQVESASSSNRKPIEVDYELERMLAPHEGRIRRQFQKGLWLQIRTSAHQRQIHAKINRIQIGNFILLLFEKLKIWRCASNNCKVQYFDIFIFRYEFFGVFSSYSFAQTICDISLI